MIQARFHRLRHHGISTAYITGMSEMAISLYGQLKYAQEVNRTYYELDAHEK